MKDPQKKKLIEHLSSGNLDNGCAAELMLKYRVRRKANTYKKQYEYASGYKVKPLTQTQCKDLRNIIQSPSSKTKVIIDDAFPQFIRGALNLSI